MLIFRKTCHADEIAQDVKNAIALKFVEHMARQIVAEVNCEKVAYHSANTVESTMENGTILRYNPSQNETGRI